MGCADRGAGGFEAGVHALHAVVALDDLSGFGIPLGRSPGAGGHAALAAHAQRGVYEDDAVFCPLLHGPRGAGHDTPGILTVKAGHEHISCARPTFHKFGAYRNDVRGLRIGREVLVGLARHLAAVASDAFLLVLIEIVNAHSIPPAQANGARESSKQ